MTREEAFRFLGLKPTATDLEAKKARLELARLLHPDQNQGNEPLRKRSEEVMKNVNVAYDVITGKNKHREPPPPQNQQNQQNPHRRKPESNPRGPQGKRVRRVVIDAKFDGYCWAGKHRIVTGEKITPYNGAWAHTGCLK